MSLKLGVTQSAYLWDYSLKESIRKLASMGFKYIGLMSAPPHIWPRAFNKQKRKVLRELVDSLGVKLLSLNPTYLDLNLASSNPGIREETVKQIKEQIDLAHDLGASIMEIVGGKRHPMLPPPFRMVWERYAKESIAECVGHAEKHKIILGLENVPSLFIERAYQIKRVIEEINSPYLRAVFDVANAKIVEPFIPLVDEIEEIKEFLVHVHLSDTDSKTWTHDPVGTKEVDFRSVGKKLKEIDFKGVSIIELTYPQDPEGGLISSKEKLLKWGWSL